MASRYDKIPSPEVTEAGLDPSNPSKKEVGKWESQGGGSSTWVPKPPKSGPLDPGFGVTVPKAKASPKPKGTQSGHAVTSGKNTTKPVK